MPHLGLQSRLALVRLHINLLNAALHPGHSDTSAELKHCQEETRHAAVI